jgi:hypothetical protein
MARGLKLVIFLFLTLSLPTCRETQSLEIVDRLAQLGLIKKSERSQITRYLMEVTSYLKQTPSPTNSAVLEALTELEYKKFGASDKYYSYISFDTTHITKQDRVEIHARLKSYLGKLNACGLLAQSHYENYAQKIDGASFIHELQLLSTLAPEVAYAEWLKSDNLLLFADSLSYYKVLSDNRHNELNRDIQAGKIVSHYQLIDYCNHAVFVDLGAYPNDPAIYLEQVHRAVSTLLPELSFSDFEYVIEKDTAQSSPDYVSYVITRIHCNGKIYQHKSFISTEDIKAHGYLGKIDHDEFYQLFNKVLSDLQSPHRLHLIKQYESNNYRYFGIIALKQEQTEMFGRHYSYLRISDESYDNALTSAQIQEAISAYQKIGVFNHLTQEQIISATEKVAQQNNNGLNDVLSCFPSVIYWFDTELGNLEDPYRKLLEAFREISHGVFNPQSISDNFNLDHEKVTVKFSLAGEEYSRTLKIDGDWVDPDFFVFVDEVVKASHLEGKFYNLPGDGQVASIIFLTDDQYRLIKEHKLLVWD